jgi:SNF2 family DNA or RNA helicase
MKALGDNNENLKVLNINVEAMATKKGMAYASRLVDLYKCMVVVDESTRIKSHQAKRTKNTIAVGAKAAYTRILTGTPITQNPLDLYSQFNFLNPYILGHSSYYTFKNRFARVQKRKAQKRVKGRMKYWTYEEIVEFRHLDELTAKIDPISFRVTKEECLDLPEKIYQEIEIPLSEDQHRLYKSMQQDLKLELESGELITAPMAITRMIKLQQILGGFIKDEFGETHSIPGNNSKLDELIYDLEDVPKNISVIIWARFRKEIESIHAKLADVDGADSCGTYYGGTAQSDRSRLIEDFQAGRTRFFVGNAQSAGLGLTLTKASLVYYFSNDFSLENRLQSEDRCHRIGQRKNVVYKDLIAIKRTGGRTVDRHVITRLKDKKDVAAIVTDNLASYREVLND